MFSGINQSGVSNPDHIYSVKIELKGIYLKILFSMSLNKKGEDRYCI